MRLTASLRGGMTIAKVANHTASFVAIWKQRFPKVHAALAGTHVVMLFGQGTHKLN